MLDNDEILTAKELASQLKVSVEWVRDHAQGRRQPALPSVRLGGRRGLLRFRQSQIDKFLKDNQRNGDR